MKKSSVAIVLGISLFLAVIGLIAIYDASVVEAYRDFSDRFRFVKQQLIALILGIGCFLVLSRIPLAFYKRYSTVIFITALLLMFIVLIPGLGTKLQGARRWIILGPLRFQPSEIFKISMVLYFSVWLEKVRPLKQFLTLLAISLVLVMLQPDLGTGTIFTLTAFSMYYLSGAQIKSILLFSAVLLASFCILIFSSSYRLDRLRTFLDPTSDQLGASYHINQVILGLGSGGLTGVGLGQSRQKYAYLPESTTDSIFVIVGEELGFIGSVSLILILFTFIYTIFRISLKAKEKQPQLLISGVGMLLLSQIFVNLGSMVALIPLTGVPLPLISYGGTSLVSTFISLGIMSSAIRNQNL